MAAGADAVSFHHEPVAGGAAVRVHARASGQPLSYRDWLAGLLQSHFVRERFSNALATVPLSAYAWECRPVCDDSLDAPLEMVVVESPALERVRPDAAPFAAQLRRAVGQSVTRFDNLGGDAHLVVPVKAASGDCYTHLAAFVRSAPMAQQQAFWGEVARAVTSRLSDGISPLWVSTAGLGVSWLHVRLDLRPKYYRHAPFRRA
jgi:hypothetical protein